MSSRRLRVTLSAVIAAEALVSGLFGALPSVAGEPARVETLRIEPGAAASLGGTPAAYDGLLTKPLGWSVRDPAVVVLWEEPGAEALRSRVIDALLDEGAAVLELDPHAARGVSPENAHAPPPPTARELLPDLFAAISALHRSARVDGEVAAVGYGAAGSAAMRLAASEATAALHVGADGPRFAGTIALGPGRPAFALGAVADGDWGPRILRLCGAVSVVVEALGEGCAAAVELRPLEYFEAFAATWNEP